MHATLRVLAPGDEAPLEAFLRRHADSSMFLRSNARAAGLAYRGERLQATYVGAWDDGELIAVAAHCWNGNLLLQAPVHADAVALEAVRQSRRAALGLLGPWDQIVAARRALGLEREPAIKSSREELFALDLHDLRVPAVLREPGVRCRHSREDELSLLAEWRVAFAAESLRDVLELPVALADLRFLHEGGNAWVLERDGRPVAFSAFNAVLPDIVQIGGVYTPPAERNRGHGRAVVAGSLMEARNSGVVRSVLFAEDPAAQQAYRALGFAVSGDYGLILFS
jgi:GNAT superfamily N-acetyltransferase